MTSFTNDFKDPQNWLPETRLVHGGTLRSQFAEMSEALFLTQGYVYDSPEQAEERFKTESGGFIYSRYANPTVAMLEERMRLLEGAGAARATASGMAAVSSALMCFLKAGEHAAGGHHGGGIKTQLLPHGALHVLHQLGGPHHQATRPCAQNGQVREIARAGALAVFARLLELSLGRGEAFFLAGFHGGMTAGVMPLS